MICTIVFELTCCAYLIGNKVGKNFMALNIFIENCKFNFKYFKQELKKHPKVIQIIDSEIHKKSI